MIWGIFRCFLGKKSSFLFTLACNYNSYKNSTYYLSASKQYYKISIINSITRFIIMILLTPPPPLTLLIFITRTKHIGAT